MSTVLLNVGLSLGVVLMGSLLIGFNINIINKYWKGTVGGKRVMSNAMAMAVTAVLAPAIVFLVGVAFVLIGNIWGL